MYLRRTIKIKVILSVQLYQKLGHTYMYEILHSSLLFYTSPSPDATEI